MARHRKRKLQEVIVSRYINVRSWYASVGAHVRVHREVEPTRFLTFEGAFDSPLDGHTEVEFMLSCRPDAFTPVEGYPASVGSLVGIRPRPVLVAVALPDDFDRVLALATTGHVRSIHIAMTKPSRGRARLVGYEVCSHVREEEE